ncbi:MAG: 5-methyltetrahydropteroyltriglutamate--homocysteine S-methyltransferase [Actinomyces graevenitzii]|jgi:5-methyltetrahydropteroyltriglutamate--homocysteine S-methyltransferase|uniref:5-methyltetrahydropteroyltriglutamate--homocysteine S-methyltransferase n=1 Tax=Actinomyces graevenitzii C83 TaxID=435830 RepID=G9PFL6_9ACTO|nr:5-methyltetrahydropteroyltriglutamate--homocysteine S-methyltransferase [Actinomyces graevenitzii]EHM88201.1 5-methyltetrahydropteroyltriglutamate-homocysteine S-methyltransferase [Actinomyces graevenitzii C83]MBS5244899.1 5-methyltetrahydropteroyltriglutamate--homocysteine S-methyltransferase [Actinomyces graevenitzii]
MSAATTQFPTATILAYPRIGRQRQLKRALEAYWAGRSSETELLEAASKLRQENLARLVELGLDASDASLADAPSFYDQVLDATVLLGAIPPRFAGRQGLDLYFALARGDEKVGPEEMTKWFDTNYHYLVPEIGPDTPLRFADDAVTRKFVQARQWGYVTRPVLVGPLTYLALAKADPATPDFDPLTRLDEAVAAYEQALASLHEAGAPWVQLDEPALTSDNLSHPRAELAKLAVGVYERLAKATNRPQILVTTPYGDASQAVGALAKTGVEAIHVDTLRGSLPKDADLSGVTLVVGAVDGRYIWRADLAALRQTLTAAQALGATKVAVATSNSLQHVPHDTALETWDDPTLNENLHAWLAFADQKVQEVVTLARGLDEGWEAIDGEVAEATRVLEQRAAAPGVVRPEVRSRTAALTDADRAREPYLEREAAQAQRLHLPPLPTTTIGSFPQTTEIRKARAANARGELSDADYQERMREEIAAVIKLQEELGLDVLVHGEAERNDMVQYFAELLDGFAATRNGWVQSYGSRCTRPSILWGDVSRPAAMTVGWSSYAQSLTDKPVKGMLTGPVTIIAWSFPRNDLPLGEIADQIGLALRDEVSDLEAAGIGAIQVDEPALRELLPLDAERHADYLDWSVGSFRLATSCVRPDTQIHTHLCYSEFGQIIDAIKGLDADVTSIEAARSKMEVVPELAEAGFDHGIGPGVWDIHAPRVPSQEELAQLIGLAADAVPVSRLWVNPDCGLKTRGYAETKASLENLVAATRQVRAERELNN